MTFSSFVNAVIQPIGSFFPVRYSTGFLVLFLLILTIFFWTRRKHNHLNLPPGPWGWPVIGILPTLAFGDPAKKLTEMGKTYGDIFSFKLGSYVVVVMNDFDLIKEAFIRSGDTFMDRPRQTMFELFTHGQGIATGFYERHHKDLRKFFLRTIRNLQLTKQESEEKIAVEVQHFAEKLASYDGAFDPQTALAIATSSISSTYLFGKTFSTEDEVFQRLVHLVFEVFETCGAAGYVNIFPSLINIPISTNRKLLINQKIVEKDFYGVVIQEHVDTYDPNNIRDLIDAFLMEIENHRDSKDPHPFKIEVLTDLMVDLFAAGTDTTYSVTRWLILLMIKYPEVQRKIQAELDDVVGRSRMPIWSDRHRLQYTQAAITEGLRFTCPGPFGVAHSPISDTKFHGYDIPKGAVILPNLYGVMYDPVAFPKPDVYLPERFLDDNGQFRTHEQFTLFGVGKRACVGEQVARIELFFFITFLVHQFTLSAPDGPESVSMERVQGLSVTPVPYDIKVTRRHLDCDPTSDILSKH